MLRVAAYQAPLLPAGSPDALALVRAQVDRCEAEGIRILCCPEAILGGLADGHPDPWKSAIRSDALDSAFASLASPTVTTIVGFTEVRAGRLYNASAVVHRGSVIGIYRKHHPAIRQSIYAAGRETPVFRVDGLTFGIVICNDSNFAEPAKTMASLGATALFVPANNALPVTRASGGLLAESRIADAARAAENRIWVIRADVAGATDGLLSYGSSEIVDPCGRIVQAARPMTEDLLVVEVDATGRPRAG